MGFLSPTHGYKFTQDDLRSIDLLKRWDGLALLSGEISDSHLRDLVSGLYNAIDAVNAEIGVTLDEEMVTSLRGVLRGRKIAYNHALQLQEARKKALRRAA